MLKAQKTSRWLWVVGIILAGASWISAQDKSPAPLTLWKKTKLTRKSAVKKLSEIDAAPASLVPPPPQPVKGDTIIPAGAEPTTELLPSPTEVLGAVAEPITGTKSNPGKILKRPLDGTDPPTKDPEFGAGMFETYKGEPKYPDLTGKRGNVEDQEMYQLLPPLGFAGRSGITPTVAADAHFVPIEDRWRIGFPEWDRYNRGHAVPDDYPYELGKWYDPYQQNVLKGDYPIIGQHIFFNLTAQSLTLVDGRQTPVATTPFESTTTPFQEEFFGSPNQVFVTQFFRLTLELFHGNTLAFKPIDWRVRISPVFNINQINADELAFVNPNVTRGTQRQRSFLALEEYFVETKLTDLSPDYDFLSARVGSQFFNSDFKGFMFFDTNRAVRIFGNRLGNREQFNLAYFRQAEKETNSGLNTMRDRAQNILIANYYRQDVIWPGFQIQLSVHYNNDRPTRRFDTNSFRARPDNAGVAQPHGLDVVYFGFATDGHIERYNITSQVYYALGHDTLNPIATRSQDIRAAMAAVELSYDRDWIRFRTSFFWASGDDNPNNRHATGFDAIFDNPNFAGGGFSYWQRQGIALFGVNLTNRESLLPNLRASKIQGQTNFVNPGLLLFNLGFDVDVTPRLRLIQNTNFIWFETMATLETFLFAGDLDNRVGTDISLGLEYRPLASNNIQLLLGVSTLIPGSGFKALYNKLDSSVDPLWAMFAQALLQY